VDAGKRNLETSIQVLDCRDQDIPVLRELFLRVRIASFVWEDPLKFKSSDFDRESSGESVLVAWADGTIVGFVSVWVPDNFVHHLYVEQSYHRRGVGSGLVKAVLDRFGSPIRLKCETSNEKAIQFYRKMGFLEMERGLAESGPFILFELSLPNL
jgi:ribosomal protein S18 acetylase RimI-like enzyme